jgi:tetratricopeptide (TPR) repeat protein
VTLARIVVRSTGAGILALSCVAGCASHSRPAVQASRYAATQVSGATIESQDPALAKALLKLRIAPSPAQHRAAADEYKRLGILDYAFDHLTAATRLNPKDAAAYDARARIWRDWGFPAFGVGDATRAVYYAPWSPAAHNTLGTLLAAAGQQDEARREFATALALDPNASFAQSNLCVLDARRGEDAAAIGRATTQCRVAAMNSAK